MAADVENRAGMTARPSHEALCAGFRWEEAIRRLDPDPAGRINLAHELVDRHAGTPAVALRWIARDGTVACSTFAELSALSGRFAGVLRDLGVGPGDRVAGYLGRVPETLVTMLGAWKAGAIYVPLFTGFGPEAIRFRCAHSEARVLVTQDEHRARVPPDHAPVERVITVAGPGSAGVEGGDLDFREALDRRPAGLAPVPRRRDAPAVLLYTSGSTGPPKGVAIAQNLIVAVYPYIRYAVDLRSDDVFWPTGDPGWGYGLVCYALSLALGIGVVSFEGAWAPETALQILQDHGVTALATTPTALRSLMAGGPALVRRYRVALRTVTSCGEPLNPEVIRFFREHWGVTVMDTYGSSEFGLPIGNLNGADLPVRPGSMGRPLPGHSMAIVDDEGRELPPGEVGQIAMRPDPEGYYSLGYWRDEARDRETLRRGFLVIGDLGRRDGDGYFWFEGRADDVIKSAGYRIGPFEVESTILRHPAVAEAAVVGKPDPLRGQIVKAFVVLRPGQTDRPGLGEEIMDLVRTQLGRHQYPREVEVVPRLPTTESGKIQRYRLR
jgi:acetyl-CoA synthetase